MRDWLVALSSLFRCPFVPSLGPSSDDRLRRPTASVLILIARLDEGEGEGQQKQRRQKTIGDGVERETALFYENT